MFRQDDLSIQQEMAMVHARIGLRHFEKQEDMLAQSELEDAVGMFPDPNIPEAQKATDALNQLRPIRRRPADNGGRDWERFIRNRNICDLARHG